MNECQTKLCKILLCRNVTTKGKRNYARESARLPRRSAMPIPTTADWLEVAPLLEPAVAAVVVEEFPVTAVPFAEVVELPELDLDAPELAVVDVPLDDDDATEARFDTALQEAAEFADAELAL